MIKSETVGFGVGCDVEHKNNLRPVHMGKSYPG